MKGKNGYFQFLIEEGEVYVEIFPPIGEGKKVSLPEMTNYIRARGYEVPSLKELLPCINKNEKSRVHIGKDMGFIINEEIVLDFSIGLMECYGIFYPPQVGGVTLTKEDILRELKEKGIHYGIQEEAINQHIQNPVYCEAILLAKGQEPVQGEKGWVEYCFDTSAILKPKHLPDGTVDFKNIVNFIPIKGGELIAKLHPTKQGKFGYDVKGKRIAPRKVEEVNFQYGDNMELSENKLELYSKINGNISLVGSKICVSKILEISKNVDHTVGNIDYNGSVVVHGSVTSGYSIQAKEDIIIDGSVEKANLKAGGKIVIKTGILGMGEGKIEAAGSIQCKFIENATVISAGNIETECILHSKVNAKKGIFVIGKKGFIIGGEVFAYQRIEAKSIGSELGGKTIISVGVDPVLRKTVMMLKNRVEEREKNLDRLGKVLDYYSECLKSKKLLPPEKMENFKEVMEEYKEILAVMNKEKKELKGLSEKMVDSEDAEIIVERDVYPGTIVKSNDNIYSIKERRYGCRFVCKKGEIKLD